MPSILKGVAAFVAMLVMTQTGGHFAATVAKTHKVTVKEQATPVVADRQDPDAYSWSRGHANAATIFPPPPEPAAAPAEVPADQAPAANQPIAALPIAQPQPPAPAPQPAPAPRPAIVIGSTQQALINGDRGGLGALNWSPCLASIAYQSAVRMANQGFISHAGAPSQDLGCGLGGQAGENVGYWSGGINDYQLNTMFMNSPDHRANIMGPYHWVGTAWVVAKNGYAYIAVEFG
ncbi:MAG: hypothetical protein NVS9B1_04080 [Candidatus Dormibacteraceae bacterium]